ncbi:MAG: PP2C family protein-serine/threonine phosphatase [Acidimicrobiia bacterium]
MTFANAGHVPPLIQLPDGPVEIWAPASAPMLGAGAEIAESSISIESGTRLVLFTDGLVERRDESILDSIERARAYLDAAPPGDLNGVCDRLIEWATSGRPREDDICILAVDFRP